MFFQYYPESHLLDDFLWYNGAVIQAIVNLVVLIQSYEWLTITIVILWQKGKDLKEIIFKLMEEGATTLIRIELATFVGLIVLAIATIAANVYG